MRECHFYADSLLDEIQFCLNVNITAITGNLWLCLLIFRHKLFRYFGIQLGS
jgi:hypothetical protein